MRDRVYTVVYMVVVATVFTGLVASLSQATRERIRLNQLLARQRILLDAFNVEVPPDAGPARVSAIYEERIRPAGLSFVTNDDQREVLAAYDEEDRLVGYAFQIAGQGLWGPIQGFLAVDRGLERIIGLRIYSHDETPGLGGEISQEWFEAQFTDLPIPEGLVAGEEAIELVLRGGEKDPSDVDAITGATQTSLSVQEFLNRQLRDFLQMMRNR